MSSNKPSLPGTGAEFLDMMCDDVQIMLSLSDKNSDNEMTMIILATPRSIHEPIEHILVTTVNAARDVDDMTPRAFRDKYPGMHMESAISSRRHIHEFMSRCNIDPDVFFNITKTPVVCGDCRETLESKLTRSVDIVERLKAITAHVDRLGGVLNGANGRGLSDEFTEAWLNEAQRILKR